MNKKIHLVSLKNIKFILKTVFVIAFIGFVIYEGREELASIKIKDVKMILKSLSVYTLVLFIGGGILAASTSIIHDFIISKELSIKLSNIKIFKIGFISNTINNALGGFSSAGMRAILYVKEGIRPKEATYYNILIVTSFSTGLFALTLIIPFNLMSIRPIFTQYKLVIITIIIMIINMSLFFTINKFTWLKKKMFGENADKIIPFCLLKKLFSSSIFEWIIVSLYFCLISLYFSPNAKFIDVFCVFIIASVIGVVSLVPGAIGTFDLTLLLGMSSINIDSHKTVASIMIFRLFYHIIPLIIALLILIPQFFKKSVKQ